MSEGPLAAWQSLVAAGTIQTDARQKEAAEALERLRTALLSHWRATDAPDLLTRIGLRPAPSPPPGLYFWGGVGRGKSMLMDLFFATLPERRAKRVHFHAFMQDVHERRHLARIAGETNGSLLARKPEADPLPAIAAELVGDAGVLCFDELHVTDIADAMILGRLFQALLASGVVLVATSNRPPRDLYKHGLQRELFEPFIALIEEKLDVFELDSGVDYRLERMKSLDVYLTPADAVARARLDESFNALTVGTRPGPATLTVQGRALTIARAAEGCAFATFEELCVRALGPADYLALAERFHTLVLADVPELSRARRNEAKRFVTLIDALYEQRCNLICSASAPPAALYPGGDGAFEFQRTASRLIEMQTAEYWAEEHRGA